jgi:FkbM family methyltransferase
MVAAYASKDYVSERFLVHEASMKASIVHVLGKKPGSVFLDIGANVGSHAFWMATRGFEVVAVEAMPDNVKLLRASLCNEGTDARVRDRLELHPVGFGLREQSCLAWSHPHNVGNGQVSCDGRKPCPECVLRGRLNLTTLDGFLEGWDHERRPLGCAKMDVECFEPHVFEGGIRTLSRGLIPHVVLEFNGPLLEGRTGMSGLRFLKLARDYGFEIRLNAFHGPLVEDFESLAEQTLDIFLTWKGST